jgi:hypothetical protein
LPLPLSTPSTTDMWHPHLGLLQPLVVPLLLPTVTSPPCLPLPPPPPPPPVSPPPPPMAAGHASSSPSVRRTRAQTLGAGERWRKTKTSSLWKPRGIK